MGSALLNSSLTEPFSPNKPRTYHDHELKSQTRSGTGILTVKPGTTPGYSDLRERRHHDENGRRRP